jgi:predicted acetyltransferase
MTRSIFILDKSGSRGVSYFMNEVIRKLTESDLPDSNALIDFAFRRENVTNEPLVDAKPEHIWGFYEDEELSSTIIIIPLEVFIHEQVHPMGLIAGVASWPEHRKNGRIGKLLVNGLSAMRANGQTISYLVPFAFPFYRKYGWELIDDYKSYTLKKACLPDWRGKGSIKRAKPKAAFLNGIYEQYALRFNGMLKRSEERWVRSIFKRKKGHIAIYSNESGESRGYIIYELIGQEMRIHELVYLDEDAQHGLWHFIRKHESMFETVTFSAPSNDRFHVLIENPKGLETKLPTHLMARIVDVEAFLVRYLFVPEEQQQTLAVTVSDEHAPWNNGLFQVTIGPDGSVSVSRMEEREAPWALSCTIQTLTVMMMGYQSPLVLHEISRLGGPVEESEKWENAILKRTVYYMDFGS